MLIKHRVMPCCDHIHYTPHLLAFLQALMAPICMQCAMPCSIICSHTIRVQNCAHGICCTSSATAYCTNQLQHLQAAARCSFTSLQSKKCICSGAQASQLRASCGQGWPLSWHKQQAPAPTSTHLQTSSKTIRRLLLELSSFQQMQTPPPSTARAPSPLLTTRTAQSGAKQPPTPWALWGTALGWPSPPPVSF